jgi:myosin heavy subunit
MMNPQSNTPTIQPSSGAKAETLVEPRASLTKAALPSNEDMFLSPRVMDAGTFARYSEMLKSIIAQATTQGRVLEDFSADAEEMIRRAGESGATLDKRLQAGVRMLRMIDERVDRTDEALDKVREILPSADTMRRQAESLMNDALDKAQSQLDGMVRDAEIRAQAAEHRARVAMQKTEERTQRLEALNADLDMRMSAIELRMEEAQNQSGQTIGLIDRRLVSFQEELNTQIDEVVAKANNATANIEQRIEDASTLTEQRVESLGSSIEPVKSAAEQAMRALGIDPENPKFEDSPLAKIESLVERGEAHIAGVDRVLRQLDELRNQAEAVKGDFGVWLLDSANKLDELEARKDLLQGPIGDAAKRIGEIGPDLEDKLELASNKLAHLSTQSGDLKQAINSSSQLAEKATDKLTNQASQLQALLDGSLHRLTQRVEQAGVWLGSLITRAEQIGQQLGGNPNAASTEILKSVEEVQAKVTELSNPSTAVEEALQNTLNQSRISKVPERLHIDSIAFDGSTAMVIEHDSGSQGAD